MKTETKLPNYRIYDRTGCGVTEDIYAETLDEAIEAGREWIEQGDWSGCGDEDEDEDGRIYKTLGLECEVGEIIYGDDGEIDEEATDDADRHDCSGEYTPELPSCEATGSPVTDDCDGQGHDWRTPFSLVGGCRENPGVWSNGGTSMSFRRVCGFCGCYKSETDPGLQRNPGEALSTITISERDEASVAWLKSRHEEDGWLRQAK